MQLTHLCLIMPSDYDKLDPLHATPQTNIKGAQKKAKSKKHPQGARGGKRNKNKSTRNKWGQLRAHRMN